MLSVPLDNQWAIYVMLSTVPILDFFSSCSLNIIIYYSFNVIVALVCNIGKERDGHLLNDFQHPLFF